MPAPVLLVPESEPTVVDTVADVLAGEPPCVPVVPDGEAVPVAPSVRVPLLPSVGAPVVFAGVPLVDELAPGAWVPSPEEVPVVVPLLAEVPEPPVPAPASAGEPPLAPEVLLIDPAPFWDPADGDTDLGALRTARAGLVTAAGAGAGDSTVAGLAAGMAATLSLGLASTEPPRWAVAAEFA